MDSLSPELSCATLLAPSAASSGGAVPFGQIFGAAHLFEPAGGPLELEAAVAGGIEAVGRGASGSEQLHLMLVERVDQRHEPRRFVAHCRAHYRDPDDDHGVVAAGDREIIDGAARLTAEPLEGEDRDALQALRNVQSPSAADIDLLRRHLCAVLDRVK